MRLFKNEAFDFETKIALGAAAYGGSEVGEVLATVGRIKDGDHDAWFREWTATGERVLTAADASATAGRRVSARDGYLRAADYLFKATSMLAGPDEQQRLLDTWRRHRAAWERWCEFGDPPVERLAISYEGTQLVGYVFKPANASGRLPTLILNNGSDGPVDSMWIDGGAAAVARGYLAVTFDGPGQGHALYEQQLPFRPDWEAVITPVVDTLLTRDDVDPDRIALQGISQGGYWVPRAVAFEHRIAAAIADPGVVDVATSWLEHVPKSLVKHLDANDRKGFDREMNLGMAFNAEARRTLAIRMRPYGVDDYFDAYQLVRTYALGDVIKDIACPMLVTDPEGEQFWAGQSQQLFDALAGPKELVKFTAEEGADLHCEPLTPKLRDQRVFDWLDGILGRG